jgi:hypothetical protein
MLRKHSCLQKGRWTPDEIFKRGTANARAFKLKLGKPALTFVVLLALTELYMDTLGILFASYLQKFKILNCSIIK